MELDLPSAPADLFITSQLAKRRTEPADFLLEKQAIYELAGRMADRPEEVLPRFVELAMQLTGATSAGISLLEPYPKPGLFRWRYLHGALATFENATTPRDFSPCGITLDRNSPVLSLHPERYYDWISQADIIVPEVLLVPLRVRDDEAVGTLWIVSREEGYFNSEHARIAEELASFVGIALRMLRTEQRLHTALQEQQTLTEEMSHRVKNLFAVSQGMVQLTARTTESKEELAQSLTGRFHALASAHSLIRRSFSPAGSPPAVSSLIDLLRTVMRPHEIAMGDQDVRFTIAGPPLVCGEHALNGIALIFHELATNATKYGALASHSGHIDIRWEFKDALVKFRWLETGGPSVDGTPAQTGFGSRLLRHTIQDQFHGTLQHSWNANGLIVEFDMPANKLVY